VTEEQIAGLAPQFTSYLNGFRPYFATKDGFAHLGVYTRGLISDLKRKSVEPIALAAGCAVRTLQEFLTFHAWDQDAVRDKLQRRVIAGHLPAPGVDRHRLGVIGIVDETSSVKKGTKTPGVQRQWCGTVGKTENGLVTVHLGCLYDQFKTLIDSDLYLPKGWSEDRDRCREAGIPDTLVYRPKWQIALEQIRRAMGNGIRFDWIVFDEGYGGKNPFLFELDALGLHWIGEVPKNFLCWPTLPKYHSLQAPFAAKRADNAATHSPRFRKRKWRRIAIPHQTEQAEVWLAKAARVYLVKDGNPTPRKYWLIVARNQKTGETKYFVSNAPHKTSLEILLLVGFRRWNVEHAFRVAKSEIGFSHYEGRKYKGLMRHMVLCMMVMLFLAEQTQRLRGEKSGTDARANRRSVQLAL
jgi:SRSO17 transposase